MNLLQTNFQTDKPVALVTGSGAPRVGQVIARHLASLGCRLALHAYQSVTEAKMSADEISKEFETEVIVTQGSLEESGTAESIVNEVAHDFGRIDILVNSAAIWHPTRLEEVTAEELLRYYQINTLSCWMAARAAGLIMAKQEAGGCIINISDWATVRPYLDHAAYFPSKGGVDAMTQSLAVELGHRNPNIRVNGIKPGPVLLAKDVDKEQQEKIAQSTLVKRVGTAEHIAHAVQFLCENTFVNGSFITVDGGRSIFAPDGLQVGMNTG
jgi:NAD(P)-dependent dehydrogenase (short-subunit alcohol dehydrogenase family)